MGYKFEYFFMRILLIAFVFISLFSSANAQSVRPLKIGDSIPDFTFTNLLNYPKTKLTISQFKGKAVILDFWATYCGSCLAHFPLSDSLQREYQNNLQIILVDGPYHSETKENILKTFKRFDHGTISFCLPTIVNDNVLIPLFPHYTIPHYVWIDKKGFIRAITAGDDINRENVSNFIKSEDVPKFEKDDFDPQRPLYTTKGLPTNQLEQFSILLKGKIEGIGNGGLREINDTVRGLILHNRSLLEMYQRIITEIIPCQSSNRLLIEVKNASGLSYINLSKVKYYDWERDNLYSYELIVPKNLTKDIFYFALDDLNKYTPYQAVVEKRKEFCWYLERQGNSDLIKTRGGAEVFALHDPKHPELRNASIKTLLVYLNEISHDAIVLDKTDYKNNIDLTFKSGVKDMLTMSKYLKDYGLKLTPGYRKIDMLIIKDK